MALAGSWCVWFNILNYPNPVVPSGQEGCRQGQAGKADVGISGYQVNKLTNLRRPTSRLLAKAMQSHAKPCKGIPSIARHTQACWTWVPVCSVLCSVLCSTKSQRIGTWPLWITRGGKHDCAMLHGVSPLRDPWFVQFLNLKKDTYLLYQPSHLLTA